MKNYLPIAVFVVVAALGLATAGYAFVAADRANAVKFEAVADDAMARVDARIEMHLSLLQATHAYFVAEAGDITRARFRTYVDGLDTLQRYAGIQGIGFAPVVPAGASALRDLEEQISRDYGSRRRVWPQTDQAWRTPTMLLEPFDHRNRAALAFDMFSERARREAMSRALISDLPQASGKVELVQEIDAEKQAGFLVYIPLVDPGRRVEDRTLRMTDVAGFVFAPFRAGDLFTAALTRSPALPVHVEAYDQEPGPESLMFRSDTAPSDSILRDYLVERRFSVAGRLWTVRFRPTDRFDPSFSRSVSLLLGIFSVLLAATLALAARTQMRALEAVAALHTAAERNLSEKELMLQEMKHRIKNSIARILAIARQTSATSETLSDFADSFFARLQAMAASQDLVTRSRWERADLKELLKMELQQAFGEEIGGCILEGPPVELDERTTQGLGLTFHELATNALKHGEVSSAGRGLDVRWRIEAPVPRHLRICWREPRSGPETPPRRTGFGTRLIDATVAGELQGSIDRDFGADALTITIRIPLP